jgi:hypothetical protein
MKAIAVSLLLFAASAAGAQSSIDPSGHWKGTIEIPNSSTAFELDLTRSGRAELAGTFTAADAVRVPLLKVTLDGRHLTFYGRSDQQFQADVASDGASMSGTASVNGYALPFTMARTGEATFDAPPTFPAVTKELAGVWKGTLEAVGRELRLVMTIANQTDGTAIGRMTSVDEGGLTLFLAVSQRGANVTVESRGIVSSFTGTLNAAGTELSGTWSQRGLSVPLTLTRGTEGAR